MSLPFRPFRAGRRRIGFGVRRRLVLRAALALSVAVIAALAARSGYATRRNARATERLNSAAQRLDSLTDATPGDDRRRAAIAWGYAERLRLGLESPFRLVEAAARDPRLTADERRTVAWALLAHIVRGETHDVDPAALDGLGPIENAASVRGEQHVALIEAAVANSRNPRAGELAVRFAYTLAAAERIVDPSASVLAAEAAAVLADREVARREAVNVVRASRDPIALVRRRRESRSFYVERPALLETEPDVEHEAIAMTPPLLESVRAMRVVPNAPEPARLGDPPATLVQPLYAAGTRVPPSAPLAVTVQRYLPMVRAHAPHVDAAALSRTRNGEMLVALIHAARLASTPVDRSERRAVARLLLASAVAMRSAAQERVWFPGDSVPAAADAATSLGLASIGFDRDVPSAWRPYFVRSLVEAVNDVRRVLPSLRLDAVHVRFRMQAPADSALAMHDPATRTLHLPVLSGGGTLAHELAHDLDRQNAVQLGLAGYRSDVAARAAGRGGAPLRPRDANSRVSASLLALTEELSETPSSSRATSERPAEIFATRVDWFVASALARRGIGNGFLSAVEDELLTGHVVHPERLRTSGRSRSLLTALEGMTTVAPFARHEADPSAQTLLRWSLAGPVDRRVASDILRGKAVPGTASSLFGGRECGGGHAMSDGRVALVRMAADARARGWMRLRARWTADAERTPWARALLRQAPWSPDLAERRVETLRDYILIQLSTNDALPAGVSAYGASVAELARCGG